MSLAETTLADQMGEKHAADDVYDDGVLRVEHKNYYVSYSGQSIRLARAEFLIFSRLARSPERTVTSEELWECAWGRTKPLNAESLHVYIYRLRNKLLPYHLRIDTLINVGYRLLLDRPAND
jgi:DNA-binding response OmpR family regulator